MNSKKLIYLITFVFSIFIFLILAAFLINNGNNISWEYKGTEDFEVTANYQGANIWEYTISGNLPNPCYSVMHSAMLNNGSVTILLEINSPSPDQLCSQVIQPVELVDTFHAPKDVVIDFKVRRDGSDNLSSEGRTIVLNSDGLFLNASYNGNFWSYSISGEKPTPCYEVNIEELIRESFPEEVVFNVSFEDTSSADTACAQVITPFTKNGELQVSEEASFELHRVDSQ